ncbi:hypothetical protein CCO03_03090 [Comamonas serinivorans]|uniref:Peptidase S8/S53 domain-containing protein n=1 Tax=Comamonas serinivorans TaxID=1082851 RepID=A0A1Y0EJI7_9BURK|nr:S8 family serine peptidase [Comamonas serinivorans]ARU03803.1 hypothetical protein CCO03_03090 [Comamonas serinivorans]
MSVLLHSMARLGLVMALCLAPFLPGAESSLPGVTVWADDDDEGDDDDDDDDDRPAQRPRPQPRVELVASGLTAAQLSTLQRGGWRLLGQRANGLLTQPVVWLLAPAGLSDPVGRLRQLAPGATVDRNHRYRSNQGRAAPAPPAHFSQVGWSATRRCTQAVPIGLIDTRVDLAHPALRGAQVQAVALPAASGSAPSARRPSTAAHGTAVASLLVGQTPELPGLLPRSRLLVVDAFHRDAQGQERLDAWDLVAALDTLAQRGARVINMSFAGEHNAVVAQALAAVHARQIVTVAAVGNRGPGAAPQFPAAFPQVIGVTAVDAGNRIYPRAGRGAHVDLAAPGVGLQTAASGRARARSGTSFAAPVVTAAVATLLTHTPPASVAQALATQASDLGPPGHDRTFGHGLLQVQRWCAVH